MSFCFKTGHWVRGVSVFILAGNVLAAEIEPIVVDTTLPIMAGAGLTPLGAARVIAPNSQRFLINSYLQSHANDAGRRDEALIIDAEVHSVGLQMQWGFAENWQATFNLAGARITRGNLDGLIDDWHDLFDLDSGDRSRQAQDQLLMIYRSTDSERRLDRPESNVSVFSLGLARQLVETQNSQLAVSVDVNLPAGGASALLDSDGKRDWRVGLAASSQRSEQIGLHANLNYLSIGDDQLFGVATKSGVWQTSLGLHWSTSDRFRWIAQLDHHSAVFETQIEEINRPALQLALAGEYLWGSQGRSAQIYFTEDLTVNRGADFSIGVAFKFDR